MIPFEKRIQNQSTSSTFINHKYNISPILKSERKVVNYFSDQKIVSIIEENKPHKNKVMKIDEPNNKQILKKTLTNQSSLYFGVDDEIDDELSDKRLKYFSHEVNFSLKQYFEFFIIHFIGLGILGPFMIIWSVLSYPKNRYLAINLQFFRFNGVCLVQTFIFTTFVFLYISVILNFKSGDMTNVYLLNIHLFMRCSIIAGKYATYPKIMIKKLRTKHLHSKELNQEMMLKDWMFQKKEIIRKEIESSIKRSEIDQGRLWLTFYKEINPKIELSIIEMTKNNENCNGDLFFRDLNIGITSKKYYDAKKILEYLINEFNKSKNNVKSIYLIAGLEAILALLQILLVRALSGQFIIGSFWFEYICSFMLFASNFILDFNLILFFRREYVDYQRKNFLLQQIGSMWSVKSIDSLFKDKLLPNLDMGCMQSVACWYDLRTMAQDYGRKYYYRHNIFLPILFAVTLVNFILGILLQFFELGTRLGFSCVTIRGLKILLLIEFFINLALTLFSISIASKVNFQLLNHTRLVKGQFKLIKEIKSFQDFYFNDEPEHRNEEESSTTRLIMRQLKVESNENSISFLKRKIINGIKKRCLKNDSSSIRYYLDELCQVYEDVVENLEESEINDDIQMLGVTLNFKVIPQFILTIISIFITAYEFQFKSNPLTECGTIYKTGNFYKYIKVFN